MENIQEEILKRSKVAKYLTCKQLDEVCGTPMVFYRADVGYDNEKAKGQIHEQIVRVFTRRLDLLAIEHCESTDGDLIVHCPNAVMDASELHEQQRLNLLRGVADSCMDTNGRKHVMYDRGLPDGRSRVIVDTRRSFAYSFIGPLLSPERLDEVRAFLIVTLHTEESPVAV